MSVERTESKGKLEGGEPLPELILVKGRTFRGAVVAEWRRWAAVLVCLEGMFREPSPDGARVSAVTVRAATDSGGPLLVVRAAIKKRQVVAFHRGESPADVIEGFALRFRRGDVAWRDDSPLQPAQSREDAVGEPIGRPPEI